MIVKTITKIKSKAEARGIAIKWQQWQSEQSTSYSEMLKWQNYFETLAKKFNLKKEFKENCII